MKLQRDKNHYFKVMLSTGTDVGECCVQLSLLGWALYLKTPWLMKPANAWSRRVDGMLDFEGHPKTVVRGEPLEYGLYLTHDALVTIWGHATYDSNVRQWTTPWATPKLKMGDPDPKKSPPKGFHADHHVGLKSACSDRFKEFLKEQGQSVD